MESKANIIVTAISIMGVIGAAIAFLLLAIDSRNGGGQLAPLLDHIQVTVGLPSAAAAAFIVVSLFKTTDGKIKFSGLGFTFEGASGPILMWVICFSVISLAIKALW